MAELLSTQQCPSCARVVYFSHDEITILQCSCGAVLQRKERLLLNTRLQVIHQPVSVIQPGTEGRWKEKPFKVTGRFRAWLEESVYSYWTIIYADSTIGYLGEGYGLYAIYEQAALNRELSSAFLDGIIVGTQRDLYRGKSYMLQNADTSYKIEIEGEVFLPECDDALRFFEFASADGKYVEAIEFRKNEVLTFNVFDVSYTSLQLTQTRKWEPYGKEISCTKCLKPNVIKTFPYAQSYACVHCGARYVLQRDGNFRMQTYRNRTEGGIAISIGASAMVKGIEYEVIGYALKEENDRDRAQWKEYTLFNAEEGFAFLSEYKGNWMYVREQGNTPYPVKEGKPELTYNKEQFRIFNRYRYETVIAAGEFPYNLFNDDEKKVLEYISPPKVWIQEKSSGEGIRWFLGEHVSRKELQAAFSEAIIMPYKEGVGAVEPKGYISGDKIATATFLASLVMIFIHIITTSALQKRVIFEHQFPFGSLHSASFVTSKFKLEKWRSNLKFDIQAPVDNSWFEMNATLVNADNGTEYSIEQGVEYYHGYSEGESWTEGSTRGTAYLSKIPAGNYFLQINGIREDKTGGYSYNSSGFENIDRFFLTVTYDTPNHRNLVVCLILLLIIPVIQYQLGKYYEESRWDNSPYSNDES